MIGGNVGQRSSCKLDLCLRDLLSHAIFSPRRNLYPPLTLLMSMVELAAILGPAGYGVAIKDASGHPVAELSEYLGHRTNNYAEYQGLLAALRYAAENQIKALKVISDSELMVRQMKGIYKVRHPELRKLYDEAQQLVRRLEHFEIRHALREHNQIADRLANEAMDRGR